MLSDWHKISIVVLACFILASLSPLIQGHHMKRTENTLLDEYPDTAYDCYILSRYDPSDTTYYKHYTERELYPIRQSVDVNTINEVFSGSRTGLMDSAWPMYCHDVRHTGRSPYMSVNATGVVKWRLETHGTAQGGPTIDSNGIIYIGSYELNAVYPNGTIKWKHMNGHSILCAPAIDDNGTIYYGSVYGDRYFYALNPNGTVKWRYYVGESVFSSPAIGDNGIIYVGSAGTSIHAIYPNGTRKWIFPTNHVVYSSPVIGEDGTIYCGCHDTYLYALNPENGTLKWKYKTGDWIRSSPCIGDDGTIYVVSLDEYLHAVYPNGTMKWKTFCGAGTSPTIGWDGTIYCGGYDLYAIYPENGSVKWIYDSPGTLEGGTPCSSIDGTIYYGTGSNGYIVAVNSDGTERWRKKIGRYADSPPAIGVDGTVYIGSSDDPGEGYLFAFGNGPLNVNANGPYAGYLQQPLQFTGTVYGGKPPYTYHWDFGDGNSSGDQNPMHTFIHCSNYTAVFAVTDSTGNQSNDTAQVTIGYPPPKITIIKPVNALYIFNIKTLSWSYPVVFGPLMIKVEASQVEIGIDRVEFYDEGTLLKTDYTPPYDCLWRAHPPPIHRYIIVRVYDVQGNQNSDAVYPNKWF